MKIRNWLYFFNGCISGIVLASTAIFVTSYRDYSSNGLNDVHSSISTEVSQPVKLYSPKHEPQGSILKRQLFLGDELRKRPRELLFVVLSSQSQAENAFNTIQYTWGQFTSSWKIGLGGTFSNDTGVKYGPKFMNRLLLASECEDLSIGTGINSYLNFFCLIKMIYEASVFEYNWWVIAPSSTYLAVNKIAHLVQSLDPNLPYFIGKLSASCSNSSQFNHNIQNCSPCDKDHAIILSHGALEELVPQLFSCLHMKTILNSQNLGRQRKGSTFEWCLSKIQLLEHFNLQVDYSTLFTSFSSNSWQQGDFISLSNIFCSKDMLKVHIHMLTQMMTKQSEEANTYVQLAHQACKNMTGTSICNLTIHESNDFVLKGKSTSYGNLFWKQQPRSNFKLQKFQKWETIKGNTIYNSDKIYPSRKMSSSDTMKLAFAVTTSLDYLGKSVSGLTLFHVPLVYVRYSGLELVEYVLDLEMKNDELEESWRCTITVFPLTTIDIVTIKTSKVNEKIVEFIVPIYNVKNNIINNFLNNYENICLIREEACGLSLVVYDKNDADYIQQFIGAMSRKYTDYKMRLVKGQGVYSQANALDLGIRNLEYNALAFLCDPGITVKRDFIRTCQRNTVEGRQVYHPEYFKYYDLEYSHHFFRNYFNSLTLNRKNGHWATYSHEMMCIYKSDYLSLGGFDASTKQWKDVFVTSLDKQNLVLLRAPDPSILQEHNDEPCSSKPAENKYSSCFTSRSEDIADRMELADYIFHLEEKCNTIDRNEWDM